MSTPPATGNMKPEEPTVASSATPVPSQSASASTPGAPPGFKLVKVRKPDGSIVTVKRKLSPEEAAAPSAPVAAQPTPALKPSAEISKIVTVRQPDGTLIKVRRAVKNQNETPAAVPHGESDAGAGEKTAAKPLSAGASQPDPTKDLKQVVASESKDVSTPLDQKAVDAPTTRTVEKDKPAPGAGPADAVVTEANLASMQDALDEQKNFFRQRKRHQFKTRLLRRVAAIAGSAVPAIEIGDMMDGDEILSDDDWSVDEDDDDDHDDHDDHGNMSDAEHDIRHGAEDEQAHATDDDDKTLEHNSNGMYCLPTAAAYF